MHADRTTRTLALALLATGLLAADAAAQNGRPAPQPPAQREVQDEDDRTDRIEQPAHRAADRADERADEAQRDEAPPRRDNSTNRRPPRDDKVILAFNDFAVTETIPFIVETTGKVVIPVNLPILQNRTITLVNDEFIDRQTALDLLFATFRLNEVGVIERDDVIILTQLTDAPQLGKLEVLDAEVDVFERKDVGNIVVKIFPVRDANAEGVFEQMVDTLPDYASMSVDPNSNQIVLMGDIGLAQQVQTLINQLDKNYVHERTETFRLAHADAHEIAENIYDLFEDFGAAGQAQRTARPAARTQQARARQAQQQQTGQIGPRVELRVTVNVQQNSVTVSAHPSVVDKIATLIHEEWDLRRPHGTSKVYRLQYTDSLRVRDTLREVLGQGAAAPGAGRAGPAGRAGQGGRGGGDVGQIVSGIYRIDAFPEANSLIVLSKTEEAFDFLDQFVEQIDQPTEVGLPLVVELKHADAVHLSEELNALLQEPGGGANLPRPARGLTGQSFAAQGGDGRDGGGGARGGNGAGQAGRIDLPWQRAPREDRSPETPLIGAARIVPIVRQNALAILVPAAQRQAMADWVEAFDRPGRQVLISAVIAEIAVSDALALGLRVGGQDVRTTTHPDFAVGGQLGIGVTEDPLTTLFTTSVLDATVDVHFMLQALSRQNRVRILQQPRIFTADNQEAQFFDGQDVPFLIGTQVTDIGTLTEQFERREVGVRLNVRPRITVHQDVDLEINLELSSVVPGTLGGGGVVIDRRETTTHVIVRDSQTIVLSGILKEQESEILRKIPLLGDIPLLGALFTSTETETTQTELIAFITPTVVDTPSENDENFNVRERQRLRGLSRPLRDHVHDPDEFRDRIIGPEELPDPARPDIPAPPSPTPHLRP